MRGYAIGAAKRSAGVLGFFVWILIGFASSAAGQNAVLRGIVIDRSGEPLQGAQVRLEPPARAVTTQRDGRFEFPGVEPGRRTLSIHPTRGARQTYFSLEVAAGEEIYAVCPSPLPGNAPEFLFRVMTPTPEHNRTRESVHIGAHTNPGNQAFINEQPVHVYNTGIFVRDHFPLAIGNNPIRIQAYAPSGLRVTRTRTLERRPPPASISLPETPLRILNQTLQPTEDIWISPGDMVELSFHGSPAAQGEFRIGGGDRWFPMAELSVEETGGLRGHYVGAITAQPSDAWPNAPIEVRLRSPRAAEPVFATARGKVTLLDPHTPLMAEVISDIADLKVGLEQVRLGGPNFTVAPKGTRLQLAGKIGAMYRIHLARSASAWVHESDIERLPPGTPLAHGTVANVRIDGDDVFDRVVIPNPQRVPYRIQTQARPASFWIDLYGLTPDSARLNADPSAAGIRRAEWEQVEPHFARLKLELNYPHIWGYDASSEDGALVVRIKRPPRLRSHRSPLTGLTIAVEAGHGGRDPGAIGLSGLTEKEVNLATAEALIPLLERAGARPVRIRVGDETASLAVKIQRALDANADLYVSLHANAASTERGYLRISGASTYYHHAFARPFAETVLNRLLELGLNNFGLVGDFNYRPIRISQMPAILVEKAFLTHPGDEEKLADPNFRANIARAVAEGIEDYVRQAIVE